MRLSVFLLPLAGLLAQSIYAQAKEIEVCTQVTTQYITNGDFATDSDWTSEDDYSIFTKSESESGYLEMPFDDSTTVTFSQTVSNLNVGPYYQMDLWWNVIVSEEEDVTCYVDITGVNGDDSTYVSFGYRTPEKDETGWVNILGQWMISSSSSAEVTLMFQTTCSGGSGTLQFKDISFKGPEIVCTSQCAASTLRISGELIQDGNFMGDDYDELWDYMGEAAIIDDDAPGGGQCLFISSDWGFYEMNQTIANAQKGHVYHASAMWRLKMPEVTAEEDLPTCTFDFKVIDVDDYVLLDLAHMTYSMTTDDSGWMSVNGTWNATVSSAIVNIRIWCSGEELPDIEIANVQLNLQTVICATPSSSAVASSTPFKSSVSSTPLVRSTPVSRSVSASSQASTPYSAPVVVPSTISISIPHPTPVSSTALSPASSSGFSTPLQSVSGASTSAFIRSTSQSFSSIIISSTSASPASGSSPSGSSPSGFSSSGSLTSSLSPSGFSPSRPSSSGSLPSGSSPSGSSSSSFSSTGSSPSRHFPSGSSPFIPSPSVSPTDPIPGPGQGTTTALSTPNENITSPLRPTTPGATSTYDLTTSGSDTKFTTSTVFTTQTSTITACPSTVTNCPVTAKTTYVTTETIVVSITVCPVAEAEGSTTASIADDGSYTSTILTTRTLTVTSCAATVTNCPASSQTTYTSIQTLVADTTVISAGAVPTSLNFIPAGTSVEATKSTAAPSDAETITPADHEIVRATVTTDSISSDKTGVSESPNSSPGSGSSVSNASPTESNNDKINTKTVTDNISAGKTGVLEGHTASIGSSGSGKTANESTTGDEMEGVSAQGASETVPSATATATDSTVNSGAHSKSNTTPETTSSAGTDVTGSHGNGGASGASSGDLRVSSTIKAAGASSTLAMVASASSHYSSVATSVAPVFKGAASLHAAQSSLLGLVAWGIVAMLV